MVSTYLDMTLDPAVLADVEAARHTLEALEDQTYEARAAYHQAIRRLHAGGGSMREIALALGLSHQRVHQIVGADGIVEVEAASTELTPLPGSESVTTTSEGDRCAFCRIERGQVDQLLAAPGPVFICAGCVEVASRVVRGGSSPAASVVSTAPAASVVPSVSAEPVMSVVSAVSAVSGSAATCTFCRNDSGTVGPMAAAEDGSTRICGRCLATCERMLAAPRPRKVMARRNARFRCSFCNTSQTDADRLIAGPGAFICGGCASAAAQVVATGQPLRGPRQVVLREARDQGRPCQFCTKAPAQLSDGLGSIVAGGRGRICQECLQRCQEVTGA